jgi:hypothetical protein
VRTRRRKFTKETSGLRRSRANNRVFSLQNVARDFLSRVLDSVQIRWRGYVVDVDRLLACRDMIVTLGRTKESTFHSPKTISHARHSFGIYM